MSPALEHSLPETRMMLSPVTQDQETQVNLVAGY
jgi:hypothetical protein